jgi:hypothetical protein
MGAMSGTIFDPHGRSVIFRRLTEPSRASIQSA